MPTLAIESQLFPTLAQPRVQTELFLAIFDIILVFTCVWQPLTTFCTFCGPGKLWRYYCEYLCVLQPLILLLYVCFAIFDIMLISIYLSCHLWHYYSEYLFVCSNLWHYISEYLCVPYNFWHYTNIYLCPAAFDIILVSIYFCLAIFDIIAVSIYLCLTSFAIIIVRVFFDTQKYYSEKLPFDF